MNFNTSSSKKKEEGSRCCKKFDNSSFEDVHHRRRQTVIVIVVVSRVVQTLYVRTYHTLYDTHDRSVIPMRTTGERAVQSNHQPATQFSLRFKRRVAVDLAITVSNDLSYLPFRLFRLSS